MDVKKQVTKTAKSLLKQAATHPRTKPVLATVMSHTTRLHPDLASLLPGGGRLELDPGDDGAKLDVIPSETSPAERRFLYKYFRCLWSGQGDVIEIGPFLGGTTRAIALGMQANPRTSSESRLRTFDRFSDYYDVARLREYTRPLVDAGDLDGSIFDALGEEVEFRRVFDAVHSGHDYWPLLEVETGGVPDRAEDAGPQHLVLDEGRPTEAVFIDGCKSWYGTKYFLREVAKVARPGCQLIFQDYGWYTCFWLPAFVERFADHLDLWASAQTTYAFVLQRALDPDAVESAFADTPEEMPDLDALLAAQVAKAEARGDLFAAVRHTMHRAAGQAYVGAHEEARAVLTALRAEDRARPHRAQIDAALKSPTYTPDGPVTLS